MIPQEPRRPNPQENQDAWQRTGGEFVSGPPPKKPAEQGKPSTLEKPASDSDSEKK